MREGMRRCEDEPIRAPFAPFAQIVQVAPFALLAGPLSWSGSPPWLSASESPLSRQ